MSQLLPRPDDQPELRLSDAERDEVAAFLRRNMSDGRLELGEFEDRLTVVYGAKTRGELVGVFDDLPTTQSRQSGGPPVRMKPGGGGFPEHLRAFVAVNVLCIFIWLVTTAPGYFWPMWVIGPWGIGLIMHRGSVAKR